MGIGGYIYGSRTRPYQYESSGNIVRFSNSGLARDCSLLDFSFPLTDELEAKIVGSYWGTGGIIEMDCAFEFHIEGKLGGFQQTLPFTKAELISVIEDEIDKKIGHESEAEVVELSIPISDEDETKKEKVASEEKKGDEKADEKGDEKGDEKAEK